MKVDGDVSAASLGVLAWRQTIVPKIPRSWGCEVSNGRAVFHRAVKECRAGKCRASQWSLWAGKKSVGGAKTGDQAEKSTESVGAKRPRVWSGPSLSTSCGKAGVGLSTKLATEFERSQRRG